MHTKGVGCCFVFFICRDTSTSSREQFLLKINWTLPNDKVTTWYLTLLYWHFNEYNQNFFWDMSYSWSLNSTTLEFFFPPLLLLLASSTSVVQNQISNVIDVYDSSGKLGIARRSQWSTFGYRQHQKKHILILSSIHGIVKMMVFLVVLAGEAARILVIPLVLSLKCLRGQNEECYCWCIQTLVIQMKLHTMEALYANTDTNIWFTNSRKKDLF